MKIFLIKCTTFFRASSILHRNQNIYCMKKSDDLTRFNWNMYDRLKMIKDRLPFMSYRELAKLFGMCPENVRYHLKALEGHGLVTIEYVNARRVIIRVNEIE